MEEFSVFEKFTGINVRTVMINCYISKTLIVYCRVHVTSCVCVFGTIISCVLLFTSLTCELARP